MQNRKITERKTWKRMRETAVPTLLALAVMLCLVLSGCSSAYKDGEYRARFRYPENGYIEYLTVTFQNGKAVSAELDGYREGDETQKRSELEQQGQNSYVKWKSGLEKSIMAAGGHSDKIKGAAGSAKYVGGVKQLYDAILKQAAAGKTGEVIVENAKPAVDSSTEKPDSASSQESGSEMTGDSVHGAESDTEESRTESETSEMTGENGGNVQSDGQNSQSTGESGGTADNSMGESTGKAD